MADLSDSIFILHEPDRQARMKHMLGQTNPTTGRTWTQAALDELPKSFWNDNCRRKIPPPAELVVRMQECFARHEHDVDSAGSPLYTSAMAACHTRQMQLIQAGYLSGALQQHKGWKECKFTSNLLCMLNCLFLADYGLLLVLNTSLFEVPHVQYALTTSASRASTIYCPYPCGSRMHTAAEFL